MRNLWLVVLPLLAAGCATAEQPASGPAAATAHASAPAARVRVGSGPALARNSCFARDAGGNIVFEPNGRPKTVPC